MARVTPMKRKPLHHHFVDYFIPHRRNAFKPNVFQKRSVTHLMLFILALKVAIVVLLVAVYPNLARLDSNVRAEMYDLIRGYRSERKVGELRVNTYLEEMALAKANDMLANNYFSHYGIDGKKPWEWLDPSTYVFAAMGENLAMDFLTSQAVFKAFQQSPSHDRNLLQKNYSEIGIAVTSGYLDGHTTNVMVVFFASPKTVRSALAEASPSVSAPAPSAPAPVVSAPPTSVTPSAPAPSGSSPTSPSAPTPEVTSQPETPPTSDAIEQPSQPPAAPAKTILIERITDAQDIDVLGAAQPDERYVFAENFTTGAIFSQGDIMQRVIAWSDRFMLGILIALILLLIINIIVKAEIQHTSVIANALALIVVTAGALYINVHRAEALGEYVIVLASSLL